MHNQSLGLPLVNGSNLQIAEQMTLRGGAGRLQRYQMRQVELQRPDLRQPWRFVDWCRGARRLRLLEPVSQGRWQPAGQMSRGELHRLLQEPRPRLLLLPLRAAL